MKNNNAKNKYPSDYSVMYKGICIGTLKAMDEKSALRLAKKTYSKPEMLTVES